ncbi:ureidoglycolate hydrolase [Terfezia boudieri ATCC MYA-4762]|uniref:Ureidoglycolate hydrolase n=1 Tax=Terfezia boudieri ATCC MYA-4762 TaxID=1051890 RepID=A0A3N4LJS9_9PEZI|nr:ureidoglycolate hydrolase [Terfezia boudieri ATCC MYA-4762]
MSPPTIYPPRTITVCAAPLTPSDFGPFGTVIQVPGTASATVNQGTAQKHTCITPFTDTYPITAPRAAANVNLFLCKPRSLLPLDAVAADDVSSGIFKVKILERHPYTTQSFIPLGLPAPTRESPSPSKFLVIVAPTLSKPGGPPDLQGLRAFVAHGNQGVTYGAGTWHAPMVVLGEREVVFVVLVHENGVESDDCQEVIVGGKGVDVEVRQGMGSGEYGLWGGEAKAKL